MSRTIEPFEESGRCINGALLVWDAHADASEAATFDDPDLIEFADDIALCSSLDALSEIMWDLTIAKGLQHYAIHVLKAGRKSVLGARMCTSWPEVWVSRYVNEAYQAIDPVLRRAKELEDGFFFDENGRCVPLIKSYWKDARKHGLGCQGLCFTIDRHDRSRYAVVFSARDDDNDAVERLTCSKNDLRIIAHLAAEAFSYMVQSCDLEDNVLSTRELRFLHTLATSDTPESALGHLSSYGGNRNLQDSIRKKLKVNTIFQAIVIATSRKWFDDVPLSISEIVRPRPGLGGWQMIDG